METGNEEWLRVWSVAQEVSDAFPDDVVLIGGVAIAVHAMEVVGLPLEYTHDVDFYVALAGWADLRERYAATPNRRLSKHQIVLRGVEMDVYLERNSKLRFDYAALRLGSKVSQGVRVAGLEHLLLLKLSALLDRGDSPHGEKDRRDVAKLLVLLEGSEPDVALGCAVKEDLVEIDRVMASSAFLELSDENAQKASKLRKRAAVFVTKLKEALR